MVSSRQRVIAVVGPTASGKSAFAESLALALDGEIVSADSMQVYRGMDIGTAKIPLSARRVPYHGIDLINPNEAFNTALYQKVAREAIENILLRGKQALICGGTGLYIRAALENFDLREAPPSREKERAKLRQGLEKEAESLGPQAFHAKLAAEDPQSAALIHPHNARRVVRAFEWLKEGSSYAEQAGGFSVFDEVYPTVLFGLTLPRKELYARINARVERMIEQGLLDEVRGLVASGYEEALTARQAIGYKELLPVLLEEQLLDRAVKQIQQATRHYAKRQITWFRRDPRILWLDARISFDELTEHALNILEKQEHSS